MRFVTCLFASPTDFLVSYSGERPEGILRCPVRRELATGEDVLLEVGFPTLPGTTLMRGQVLGADGDRAIIGLNAGDGRSRDFLLDVARGAPSASQRVTRGHRRIPATLPVSCRVDEIDEPCDMTVTGHTHDLGAGGVFVHALDAPAVGTRVCMQLGPAPGTGRTFSVDGQVAWVRRDARARGFGVKFDSRGEHDGPRLRSALRRAWESGRLLLT